MINSEFCHSVSDKSVGSGKCESKTMTNSSLIQQVKQIKHGKHHSNINDIYIYIYLNKDSVGEYLSYLIKPK